jgi:glycosyltransferase involved in cell wall biosynthesis
MTPLVSIVIPTYNRARDLERALASVRVQSFSDWEALVVDNHSTDDTDAVVSRFGDPRITLHKIHNDGIIAASRNLGIQRARGDFVAFLDSDDWWTPRKLEESVAPLLDGADVVYHDLFSVQRAGQKLFWRKARTRPLRSPVFDDLVSNGTALTTSSVVMRRTVLQAIGGFTEDGPMVGMEDYDAWLRASQITERFVRIQGPLGYYWEGGGNTSSAERTLGLLDLFETRYGAPYRSSRADADISWVDYDRGRSHFRLGELRQARTSLRRVQLLRVPPVIAAKTLWTLVLIALRGATRGEAQ